MTIKQQIKYHKVNKLYAQITREVADKCMKVNYGYIVNYSKDFIIVQESDDFNMLGFLVFPINQLNKIRFNNNDKYYNKIMDWEEEGGKIGIPYKINLSTWQSIFHSIKNLNFGVIVECEDPAIDSFTIGPIVRTSKTAVKIMYFNAQGILDNKPTTISFNEISKILFDDRYINVFSKYLRHKKKRTSSS